MSAPMFSIRDARASDLDAMVRLLRQLFKIEDDFEFNEIKQRHGLAALLADRERSTIKIAVVNNVVVGMVTGQITISTAEGGLSALIEDMVVDSSVRRNGIGRALLSSVKDWAVYHGCCRMQLLADKRNESALRFYHQLGWTFTHMICLTSKPSGSASSGGFRVGKHNISAGGGIHACT